MERLEDLYYQEKIYRAWVLCGTDKEAVETAQWLDENNHTVVVITTDDIEDERLRYSVKIDVFKDSARVLVISYPAWKAIEQEIEVNVLPEQNLFAIGNLDIDVCQYVKRRLADSESRGFKSRFSKCHVLHMYEETCA